MAHSGARTKRASHARPAARPAPSGAGTPVSGDWLRLIGGEWTQMDITGWALTQLRRIAANVSNKWKDKLTREGSNALERWMLSAANNSTSARVPTKEKPLVLYDALEADKNSRDKFASELHDKGLTSSKMGGERIANMIIAESLKRMSEPAPAAIEIAVAGSEIVCAALDRKGAQFKRFVFPISPRIAILLQLVDRDPAESVAWAMMRYTAVVSGGQQWGLVQAHHRKLYDSGFCNEGFSSPFNSRMLMAAASQGAAPADERRVRFCSLFKDTDEAFGSLGSIFNVDLNRDSCVVDGHIKWGVNPPYIESVMSRMAAHLDAALEAADPARPLLIFCLLPGWADCPGVVGVTGSKFVVGLNHMKKGEHQMEEPGGGHLRAFFENFYVALRSSPPSDLEKGEIMRLLRAI